MWNREFGSRDLTALVPKSKKPVNNLTIATTKGWDITIGWTILLKIAQLTPKFHTQKKESNNYMRWQLKGTCHKTYESCFCWHILKILFAWLSWWSSYFKSLTQNIYTSTHCFYIGIYYIGIIYIYIYIIIYLYWYYFFIGILALGQPFKALKPVGQYKSKTNFIFRRWATPATTVFLQQDYFNGNPYQQQPN